VAWVGWGASIYDLRFMIYDFGGAGGVDARMMAVGRAGLPQRGRDAEGAETGRELTVVDHC